MPTASNKLYDLSFLVLQRSLEQLDLFFLVTVGGLGLRGGRSGHFQVLALAMLGLLHEAVLPQVDGERTHGQR
jgi:hypothetical protein